MLGTFGVYYREPRKPADTDKDVVHTLAQTAAIVIERELENEYRRQATLELSRSEQKLQRQRRVYETALSNIPDVVYIFDLNYRFAYANPALVAMYGATEVVGKTFLELGYEAWHAEMHNREIDTVVATRRPIRGDVPFTGTNGTRIYDYIFAPVIGESGEVEAVAGTTRDVTDRHEAEHALRQSEEWRRLALEASHSFGIWDWDVVRNLFTADSRFGALYGLTAEEARQGVPLERIIERIHPDDVDRIGEAIRAALKQGGPYHQEFRVVLEDGSVRWISAKGNVQMGPTGIAIRFPGAGVDITTEREALDALRENERHLRFLTELEEATRPLTSAATIMEIATRMTAEHLDASRCAYADVEPDGDHFTIRADHVADGSPSTTGYYSLALFGSKAVADLNAGKALVIRDIGRELAAEDGREMFHAIGIDAIITCPLVKDGHLLGMMAVHSSRPREWTPGEIKVMQAVAERCWAYIERVRHEAMLQEADARKDEFLATLAHELRNPMAPLRNALYVLKSAEAAPVLRQDALDLMQRQIEQMVRLVDDLMDVSRITRGRIELHKAPVEFAEIIRNAIETAQPLLGERRHAFTADIPQEPVFIDGDAVRMAQIFANLLTNAAKYTDPGGQITLRARVEKDMMAVEVEDNGIGIAADVLPRIFDVFAQADTSLERAQGGLGIGLSLARRLTELHGGRLTAHSDGPGRGSVFRVSLPLAKAPQGAAQQEVQAASVESESTSLRVMVVDDNQASAQTMGWTLELFGCQVVTANNAKDAFKLAEATKPGLILLDIGMPDMNGYELCAALKQVPGLENTVFAAQTGWGQEEHRRRSKEAGFNYHLVKPVSIEALKTIVESLGDQSQ